jgi:dienelactone hydrolase
MRIRTAAGVVAASCLGAGAAAVAAGRYASRFALDPHPDGVTRDELLTVHTVAPDRITVTRSLASTRPGVYGLAGEDFHATVGDVLATAPDTVTRELRRVSHGTPKAGARARWTPQIHSGDPHATLGLEYAEDPVQGELGFLPAWFVPNERSTWAVAVHGLGATREQPLAVLPFLHGLGLPVLCVSHRNDAGAPRSADRVSHLGETEWRDVDAALSHAVRYGAERVVLYGWSTGAAMALRVADHSHLRDRIAGLVLDSPLLDWRQAVRSLAAEHGVPDALLPLATRAAAGRTGLRADRLGGSADPDRLRHPVFIAHGPGDGVASWQTSWEFAARRPDLVTLHTVPDADHQAMWNADPESYEDALRRFLTSVI